jgi:hypothetical protein
LKLKRASTIKVDDESQYYIRKIEPKEMPAFDRSLTNQGKSNINLKMSNSSGALHETTGFKAANEATNIDLTDEEKQK